MLNHSKQWIKKKYLGGRNEFMVNLNTVEKIELESSCKLTPKILKRMPFAIYDHMSFFVKEDAEILNALMVPYSSIYDEKWNRL